MKDWIPLITGLVAALIPGLVLLNAVLDRRNVRSRLRKDIDAWKDLDLLPATKAVLEDAIHYQAVEVRGQVVDAQWLRWFAGTTGSVMATLVFVLTLLTVPLVGVEPPLVLWLVAVGAVAVSLSTAGMTWGLRQKAKAVLASRTAPVPTPTPAPGPETGSAPTPGVA